MSLFLLRRIRLAGVFLLLLGGVCSQAGAGGSGLRLGLGLRLREGCAARNLSPNTDPNLNPAAPSPTEALARRLDALIAPIAEHAAVGLCVRSLDHGEELYARNADMAFTPASNEKLLTAAATLDVLGPDHRFSTRVLALGQRRGETVAGDLALQGGGDPTLDMAGLGALAAEVAAAGIRRVTGRVRGDDSVFDERRWGRGWGWDDEAYPYAAPISGLTLNGNTVGIEVRPGARPGLPPLARLDPPAAPMVVRVRAMTAPAGESASLRIDRTYGRDEIVIAGRLPCDGASITGRVTVEDPPLYAAAVFTALLKARGIQIAGAPAVMATPGGAVPLGEVRSPPLPAIIRLMDKYSVNLTAELLLRALGKTRAGTGPGTAPAGEAVVQAFVEREGLRGPSLLPADGSGLSRFDLVSPRNLVCLLAAMDRHPARAAFFDSLPVAGVDGTLRHRMIGTAAAGAVRAKTGTLTHVTALTGIATTPEGERLAFSLLTNNYPGPLSGPHGPRAMEDAVAAALAAFRRSAFGVRTNPTDPTDPTDSTAEHRTPNARRYSNSASTMTRPWRQRQLTLRARARAICSP